MADEIKCSGSIRVTNGGLKIQQSASESQTQAVLGAHMPVVIVGTSEEDLSVGDVATLGVVWLQNLDDTNYVTFGPKSGGSMVPYGRINPGEWEKFRFEPGITHRWQANTASVKVLVVLLNN